VREFQQQQTTRYQLEFKHEFKEQMIESDKKVKRHETWLGSSQISFVLA
jgi:hypothetical protein